MTPDHVRRHKFSCGDVTWAGSPGYMHLATDGNTMESPVFTVKSSDLQTHKRPLSCDITLRNSSLQGLKVLTADLRGDPLCHR